MPRTTRPCTPSLPAAGYSPRPTWSLCSTRGPHGKTSPPPSFRPWSNRPSAGLACGNPIRGKVAFLGGPLHFLPELRKRFIATLRLAPEEVVPFPNAQYMVALGTALSLVDLPGAARIGRHGAVTLGTLAERARVPGRCRGSDGLPPSAVRQRSRLRSVPRTPQPGRRPAPSPLESASGPLFLGVDLGSTTVKAVLADADGAVLTSWYERNQGDPLAGLLPYLADLIDSLPEGAWIQSSVATGYGARSRRPPSARCPPTWKRMHT